MPFLPPFAGIIWPVNCFLLLLFPKVSYTSANFSLVFYHVVLKLLILYFVHAPSVLLKFSVCSKIVGPCRLINASLHCNETAGFVAIDVSHYFVSHVFLFTLPMLDVITWHLPTHMENGLPSVRLCWLVRSVMLKRQFIPYHRKRPRGRKTKRQLHPALLLMTSRAH